jgi:hypothetical protein
MSRKTITLLGWILIPIGVVLACISSYSLTRFLFSNTFTFWKSLYSPPTSAAMIIEADRNDIWVKAESGELFTITLRCNNNELCKKWIKVEIIEKTNIENFTSLQRSDNCEELDEEELPRNPEGIVTECVLAIYPGPEYDFKTYYALMSDGSIKYWRYEGSGYGSFIFHITLFFILSSSLLVIFIKIRKKVTTNEAAD